MIQDTEKMLMELCQLFEANCLTLPLDTKKWYEIKKKEQGEDDSRLSPRLEDYGKLAELAKKRNQ